MTDPDISQNELIRIARTELTGPEFDVWLTKTIADKGRRAGSLTLGITEDAWRYRYAQAIRKINAALEKGSSMKTTWQMNALELQQHHAKQVEEITRMLDTATAPAEAQDRRRRGLIAGRSAAGDEQRLRAIPCIARGVAGAIPGTSPHKIR